MSLPDQDDERWSFASKSDDEHDSIGLELEAVSLTPQTPALRPHPPSISTEWQLPSPADKTGMVSGSPSDGGRFIQSIWSLSPIAKTIKNTWESTPRASKRKASMPKMSDYKRKASSETLENIEGGIDAGNSALFNTINTTNDNFRRLEFEAPRKGQLGLVIEAKDNMGPIVHGVKDYSPLFGLVQAGDQIVEVDGRKTSQSTLSEITKLLAVRPGRRSSNLRIVVSRSMKPSSSQLLHSVNHTRDNSYGSSSIASSKILEDIDAGSEVSVDDVLKYSKQGNLR